MASTTKATKLTPEAYRSLMKKYGILFEGQINPEEWPSDYAGIFRTIEEISWIRLAASAWEFNTGDDTAFTMLKLRVKDLRTSARDALRDLAAETEWRLLVENKVIEPFRSYVLCPTCHKHRSQPLFEVLPVEDAAKKIFGEKRSRRPMCTCGPTASSDKDAHTEFARKIERQIVHEDVASLEQAGLRNQKPDTIIGLGRTLSFDLYTSRMSRRHSPFGNEDVLYPFMVIEAKAAKAPDSFEMVECQSAFAIRTCLQLQRNLRLETEVEHQCLVWFFAFKGEEWRLYAAVPQGHETRVIDLWHGAITSRDRALQLILIVDYLRSWAYEVYRESVLRCLTGGRLNLKRLTPGVTSPIQADENAGVQAHGMFTSSTSSYTHAAYMAGTVSKVPAPNTHSEGRESRRDNDPYNWGRWLSPHESGHTWTENMAIRHANLINLERVSLVLPEDIPSLESWLRSIFPQETTQTMARRLLALFLDHSISVMTNDITPTIIGERGRPNTPVLSLHGCRFGINMEDWQLSRHMLCVCSTVIGLECLAYLCGGYNPDIVSEISRHDREAFLQAVEWPLSISGHKSATLSLGNSLFSLRVIRPDSESRGFEWTENFPGAGEWNLEDLFRAVLRATQTGNTQIPSLQRTRDQHRVQSAATRSSPMSMALGAAHPISEPGMIIKRPGRWPSHVQDFCFVVTEDRIDFGDMALLAALLHRAKESGALIGSESTGSYGKAVAASLERCIDQLKADAVDQEVTESSD